MTTPRAHADMAKLYFSDKEMQCWIWVQDTYWSPDDNPIFHPEHIYHVGKTAPTDPPQTMCELAGVKFPMPCTEALSEDTDYFVPLISPTEDVDEYCWNGYSADYYFLDAGLIHLNQQGARLHAEALIAASKQAIKKAREQMK